MFQFGENMWNNKRVISEKWNSK